MENSSKNFPVYELRCKCSTCKREKESKVDKEALDALQRVREDFGKAMVLTSAYRCSEHPDEAKKDRPGQHNKGVAFDIYVPWGRDRMRLVELALKHGFKGFGFANSFLHIDKRNGKLTSWTY